MYFLCRCMLGSRSGEPLGLATKNLRVVVREFLYVIHGVIQTFLPVGIAPTPKLDVLSDGLGASR